MINRKYDNFPVHYGRFSEDPPRVPPLLSLIIAISLLWIVPDFAHGAPDASQTKTVNNRTALHETLEGIKREDDREN